MKEIIKQLNKTTDMSINEFDKMTLDDIENINTVEQPQEDISLSSVSWLSAKYKKGNEKVFKKVGNKYFTQKKYKTIFKNLYINNKTTFKQTNYYYCLKYKKQNLLL